MVSAYTRRHRAITAVPGILDRPRSRTMTPKVWRSRTSNTLPRSRGTMRPSFA